MPRYLGMTGRVYHSDLGRISGDWNAINVDCECASPKTREDRVLMVMGDAIASVSLVETILKIL
jgi:hypothetical protein